MTDVTRIAEGLADLAAAAARTIERVETLGPIVAAMRETLRGGGLSSSRATVALPRMPSIWRRSM